MSEEGCIDFGYFLYNYGRFHNNSINRLIHLIFIPVITVSGGAMVGIKGPYIEFESDLPFIGQFMENPNHLSSIVFVFNLLCLIYTIVDPLIGVLQLLQWWPIYIYM